MTTTLRCGCSGRHEPATACDAIVCSCGNAPHLDGFATVALKPEGWVATRASGGSVPDSEWAGHLQCLSCGAVFEESGAFLGIAPIRDESIDRCACGDVRLGGAAVAMEGEVPGVVTAHRPDRCGTVVA